MPKNTPRVLVDLFLKRGLAYERLSGRWPQFCNDLRHSREAGTTEDRLVPLVKERITLVDDAAEKFRETAIALLGVADGVGIYCPALRSVAESPIDLIDGNADGAKDLSQQLVRELKTIRDGEAGDAKPPGTVDQRAFQLLLDDQSLTHDQIVKKLECNKKTLASRARCPKYHDLRQKLGVGRHRGWKDKNGNMDTSR
jgi:hypothetical protein